MTTLRALLAEARAWFTPHATIPRAATIQCDGSKVRAWMDRVDAKLAKKPKPRKP